MTPVHTVTEQQAPDPARRRELADTGKARGAQEGPPRADIKAPVAARPAPISVSISTRGKELAGTQSSVARYQGQLRKLDGGRAERISQLRGSIAEGGLQSPEVLDNVAATVLRLPQFRASTTSSPREPAGSEAAGRKLLGIIAERARQGEFDRPQVQEFVASRILGELSQA